MKMKRPAAIAQPKSGMRASCFFAMKRNDAGNRDEHRPDVDRRRVVGHERRRGGPDRAARAPSPRASRPARRASTRDHSRASASTRSPVRSTSAADQRADASPRIVAHDERNGRQEGAKHGSPRHGILATWTSGRPTTFFRTSSRSPASFAGSSRSRSRRPDRAGATSTRRRSRSASGSSSTRPTAASRA